MMMMIMMMMMMMIIIIIIIIIIIWNMYVNRRCNFRRQKYDQERAETILDYEEFTTGLQRMWDVKSNVISVIIKAIRIISKSFTKYLSSIPRKHEIEKLETTATLGTAQYFGKC